jgi:Flp pilus assembly protein TadG
MTPRRQSGLVSVEFAIIGALLMTVTFAVIEFGRALYTQNLLTEGARRGARLAAVCPVGDPKPASAAIFDAGSGSSGFIPGLTTANVLVQYLDTNGNPIPSPATNFGTIHYVRVSIINFTLPLTIPVLMPTVQMSGFTATLPRESLGVPRVGVVQPC